MHIVDGRLYGRNYGHVFLAVPFVWALRALSVVADPRILLAALWSLGLIAFSGQFGRVTSRHRRVLAGGSLLALFVFAVNVWLATPLADRWIPHLAFQLSTIVAAGLLVTLLYRLLKLLTSQRTAMMLGTAAAISTPIAFWAPLPKRHTMSALLVLATVYSFARGRDVEGHSSARRFRALAYVWVGLLTWVNAAEGLAVFVGLVAVDVLTARENTVTELATVAGAFLLSLLPFFATNTLVVGNPVLPPNLWPNFNGNQPVFVDGEWWNKADPPGGGEGGSGGGGSTDPNTGDPSHPGALPGIGFVSSAVSTLTDGIDRLIGRMDRGLSLLTDEPDRLYRTFVRSGWSSTQARDSQAINMAMLETAPLFGGLLALPALARRGKLSVPSEWSPRHQTDLLVFVLGFALLFFYLRRLPIHASVTVRYLHPLLPLLVYAAGRTSGVQSVIETRLRTVLWTYAAGILVGGQLLIIGLFLFTSSIGEAVQLHALINLSFAGALGFWVLGFETVLDDDRSLTLGAILLGLTISAGTVTMLFLSWNHLTYGDPVLGIGRLFRVVVPP
jgi:hypothetical protein